MRVYTTLPCISKDSNTKEVTRYEHDVDLATVAGYYPAFGDDSETTNVDFDNGDGISVDMSVDKFRELLKTVQSGLTWVWYNG